MVWASGHGMVYAMVWRALHGIIFLQYGMAWRGMSWYVESYRITCIKALPWAIVPFTLEVLFTRTGPVHK